MSRILEHAKSFFDACETGKGWEDCSPYCHPEATFSAQAAALSDIETVEGYCEWMKNLLRVCPESWYCVTSISTKIYKRSFDGDLAKDAIERNPTPTVSVIRLLLKWLRPFKVYPPLY